MEPEIPVLLRVAATLTGSKADAEDLVQETVVRAWKAVEKFDGAHPRAWLLTILRNTNVNLHRRQRPDTLADPSDQLGARPAFGLAATPGPEEVYVDHILDDDLERAVRLLPAQFRTVLLLVDVDQLSYADAARTLGLPLGTVMSRISRARHKVREHLRSVDAPLIGERRRCSGSS